LAYKLLARDLVNSISDGTWKEMQDLLQERELLKDPVVEILSSASATINVLWDADLVDAHMLLIPNEEEWYLLIDKSVTDFDKGVPLRIAQNYFVKALLHEVWHFYSRKYAIETCCWSNPVDGDAFAPAEVNEHEEKVAELFSLFIRLGDPKKIVKDLEDSEFDVNKISVEHYNAEPEEIAKYFIAFGSHRWHYFKYSMGSSTYDDDFIPSNYTPNARAKLRDVNFMRNADTALNRSICNFFTDGGKTDTVHVSSQIDGEEFCCHATYYKFPYKKGQRHNITCFGTPKGMKGGKE